MAFFWGVFDDFRESKRQSGNSVRLEKLRLEKTFKRQKRQKRTILRQSKKEEEKEKVISKDSLRELKIANNCNLKQSIVEFGWGAFFRVRL